MALAVALVAAACGGGDDPSTGAEVDPESSLAGQTAASGDGAATDSATAAGGDGETGTDGEDPDRTDADAEPGDDLDAGFGDPWITGAWAAAGADRPTEPTAIGSITDFGAVADDERSDSTALAAAVAAAVATAGPAVIDIPAGAFHLTEPLELRSGVILRGRGDASELLIDFDGRDGAAIVARGEPSGDWVGLAADRRPGATGLELAGDHRLRPGDTVEVEERSNDEVMYTIDDWRVDWGEGSVGELNRVAAVDGSTVTLATPLNGTYRVDQDAAIRRIDPVATIGLENLAVSRLDEGYGDTLQFDFATDVWIDGVASRRTSRAHVSMNQVYRCHIDDSTFHLATDYGDGGRAYGISLARHATGCLISDNALWDLRHAIIIQLGASGNVVTGNDARGSAGYEDRQPRADLSLHGHWPQANLFEGNVFDRVVFADWWGPSGPGNTLFRNCVLDHVIVTDQSDDQVLAANLIGPGGLSIDDDIVGTRALDNQLVLPDGPVVAAPSNEPGDVPESLVARARVAATASPLEPGLDPSACRVPASDRSPIAPG